jgi:hypothetical protein
VVPKQKPDSGKPKAGATPREGVGSGAETAPTQVAGTSGDGPTAAAPAAAVVAGLAAVAPVGAVAAAPSHHLPLVLQLMGQKPSAAQ